jgi:hypothetical protein
MFILFCVLQGVVQGFAWGVMIWLWAIKLNLPETSSYPIIDFAVKTHFAYPALSAADPEAAHGPGGDLNAAIGDGLIRKRLRGVKTMVHK